MASTGFGQPVKLACAVDNSTSAVQTSSAFSHSRDLTSVAVGQESGRWPDSRALMTAVLAQPSVRGFDDAECPVCFETLSNQDPAHTLRSLPCRHSFCTRCAGSVPAGLPVDVYGRCKHFARTHLVTMFPGRLCSKPGTLICPMCRERHAPLVKAQLAEAIDPTGFLEPSMQLSGLEVNTPCFCCT